MVRLVTLPTLSLWRRGTSSTFPAVQSTRSLPTPPCLVFPHIRSHTPPSSLVTLHKILFHAGSATPNFIFYAGVRDPNLCFPRGFLCGGRGPQPLFLAPGSGTPTFVISAGVTREPQPLFLARGSGTPNFGCTRGSGTLSVVFITVFVPRHATSPRHAKPHHTTPHHAAQHHTTLHNTTPHHHFFCLPRHSIHHYFAPSY